MNIVEWIHGQLGRELSPQEIELLSHLSAQGMAKINADLTRGVELELTMCDLRTVYAAVQHRRENLMRTFPAFARGAITQLEQSDQLGRPLTANEMMFVANRCCQFGTFQDPLDSTGRLTEGCDLEDGAIGLLEEQLGQMSSLRASEGASLHRSRLVTTSRPMNFTCPITYLHGSDSSCTKIQPTPRGTSKKREGPKMSTAPPAVAISPIATWFCESRDTPLEVASTISVTIVDPLRCPTTTESLISTASTCAGPLSASPSSCFDPQNTAHTTTVPGHFYLQRLGTAILPNVQKASEDLESGSDEEPTPRPSISASSGSDSIALPSPMANARAGFGRGYPQLRFRRMVSFQLPIPEGQETPISVPAISTKSCQNGVSCNDSMGCRSSYSQKVRAFFARKWPKTAL